MKFYVIEAQSLPLTYRFRSLFNDCVGSSVGSIKEAKKQGEIHQRIIEKIYNVSSEDVSENNSMMMKILEIKKTLGLKGMSYRGIGRMIGSDGLAIHPQQVKNLLRKLHENSLITIEEAVLFKQTRYLGRSKLHDEDA